MLAGEEERQLPPRRRHYWRCAYKSRVPPYTLRMTLGPLLLSTRAFYRPVMSLESIRQVTIKIFISNIFMAWDD